MSARTPVPLLSAALAAIVVAATVFAAPAAAQYGGGGGTMTFFVSPVRVPVDQTFTGFGTGCDDGDEVEISIDGVPGVLATTTAAPPNGTFSAPGIGVPDGLFAGDDHDVRATCENGDTLTFTITLVCPSGDDPVDGACEDGSDGIAGGVGPTTTTTTTTTTTPDPDDAGGTTGGSGPDGSGTDGSPPLAFTGAAFTGWLLQVSMTLVGLGVLIVVAARRRLNDDASVA